MEKINTKLQEVFDAIATTNSWGDKESISGSGSTFKATDKIRNNIPLILTKYNIKSILDIPCGDVNWMRFLFPFYLHRHIKYIGADISNVVLANNKHLQTDLVDFQQLDLCNSVLPKIDLIISRDVIGHLSYENAFNAIVNIKNSGAKYWLTTSFINKDNPLQNIKDGQWYPINLLRPPFNLIPIEIINEACVEGGGVFRDKSLMLFDVSNNDFIADESSLRKITYSQIINNVIINKSII